MSDTISKQHNQEERVYILYDKKGKILGRYSYYDAEKRKAIACDPQDVIKAVIGASDQLKEGTFDVLETRLSKQSHLKDMKVDVQKKELVARKTKSTEE